MRVNTSTLVFITFFCGLLFTTLTQALENSIHISLESIAGNFPDCSYQLNQYNVSIDNNKLLINGKQVLDARGKKLIEVFVDDKTIYLLINNHQKFFPQM